MKEGGGNIRVRQKLEDATLLAVKIKKEPQAKECRQLRGATKGNGTDFLCLKELQPC